MSDHQHQPSLIARAKGDQPTLERLFEVIPRYVGETAWTLAYTLFEELLDRVAGIERRLGESEPAAATMPKPEIGFVTYAEDGRRRLTWNGRPLQRGQRVCLHRMVLAPSTAEPEWHTIIGWDVETRRVQLTGAHCGWFGAEHIVALGGVENLDDVHSERVVAQPLIPGMKLVPTEPTAEMVNAYVAELERQGASLDPWVSPSALYRAMLAAAPAFDRTEPPKK